MTHIDSAFTAPAHYERSDRFRSDTPMSENLKAEEDAYEKRRE